MSPFRLFQVAILVTEKPGDLSQACVETHVDGKPGHVTRYMPKADAVRLAETIRDNATTGV